MELSMVALYCSSIYSADNDAASDIEMFGLNRVRYHSFYF